MEIVFEMYNQGGAIKFTLKGGNMPSEEAERLYRYNELNMHLRSMNAYFADDILICNQISDIPVGTLSTPPETLLKWLNVE